MPRKQNKPKTPGAVRLMLVQKALGYASGAAISSRLGIAPTAWTNFINGRPISKEVAIKLAQTFPGLTTDYLFFGARHTLSVEMSERLDRAEKERRA